MTLLPLEDAIARITQELKPLPEVTLPIQDVLGMALSQPLKATQLLPPFDNSAMDGYAVKSSETQSASKREPTTLRVQETIAAGHPTGQSLAAGAAMRIFTGAPMPKNADAVVIQENTDSNGDTVHIHQAANPGDHIRFAGEDVKPGQRLLGKHHVVGPGDIAMFIAQGHTETAVIRPPTVAILPTGDELVEAGTLPGPGQIANSNGIMIQTMCKSLGMNPVLFPIVRDNQTALTQALVEASKSADFILTIGGVSVGDFDHVLSAIQEKGEISFWKVAIKPGKPLAFGTINKTPVMGLPGNPASAFVCFELFARIALLTLAGRPTARRLTLEAKLQTTTRQNPSRQQFLRARLFKQGNQYMVEAASVQGSGQLSSMLDINSLIQIPTGHSDIKAGEKVSVIALDRYFMG